MKKLLLLLNLFLVLGTASAQTGHYKSGKGSSHKGGITKMRRPMNITGKENRN